MDLFIAALHLQGVETAVEGQHEIDVDYTIAANIQDAIEIMCSRMATKYPGHYVRKYVVQQIDPEMLVDILGQGAWTVLSTKPLNFTPTEEEAALIERAAHFDTDAQTRLAKRHNILFCHFPSSVRGYARFVDASAEAPVLAAPIIN